MKNLFLLMAFVAVVFTSTAFAGATSSYTIPSESGTVTKATGDQITDMKFATANFKKVKNYTNGSETGTIFAANDKKFPVIAGFTLDSLSATGFYILTGKIGLAWISDVTYNIVADGDTIKAKRDEKVRLEFAAADNLDTLGVWKNPVTGADELQLKAKNGDDFFLQPGATCTVDKTTGKVTYTGILGDNGQDENPAEVPWWAKAILAFCCVAAVAGILKWIRVW